LTKNEAYATPKAPTAGISQSIDHYNKKKEETLKSIAEQERQRQEFLTQMASFTEELQQCIGTGGPLGESAIQSLQHAIKALGNLAHTIAVAKCYWEGMGDLCGDVSESHEYLEELVGDDEIAKMLEDDTFKKHAIRYFGSWVALNVTFVNNTKERFNMSRRMLTFRFENVLLLKKLVLQYWVLLSSLKSSLLFNTRRPLEQMFIPCRHSLL